MSLELLKSAAKRWQQNEKVNAFFCPHDPVMHGRLYVEV